MDTNNFTIAEQKDYFPFIDGLRGIAILMVVAVHTGQYVGIGNHDQESFLFGYFEKLINSGARGVELFFMVSAFTLFASSFRRFKADQYPKIYFYIRRAFRILPCWWIMVLLYGFIEGKTLHQLLPSLLFYFGFVRFDAAAEVVSGGWSLFVEECFYVLLPLIFSRVTNLKRSFFFLLLCFMIHLLWRFGAPALVAHDTNAFIFAFPLNHWFCFAIGIFIYHLIQVESFKMCNYKCGSRELLAINIMTVAVLIIFITKSLVLSTLPLLLMFVVSANENTLFGKITRKRLLMRFGGYCYSIYLSHFLLLSTLEPARISFVKFAHMDKLPSYINFILYFPIVLLFALGIGFISFNLIERPCVQLAKEVIRIIENMTLRPINVCASPEVK